MTSRRNVLLGLGASAAAGGAVFGTSAFDSVTANRTATLSVVGDADAYLGLKVADRDDEKEGTQNAYAEKTQNDTLGLTFTDNNNGGKGLGQNSTYRFDPVFLIVNQGTQAVSMDYGLGDKPNGIDTFELKVTGGSGADSNTPYKLGEGSEVGPGHDLQIGIDISTGTGSADEGDLSINIKAGEDLGQSNPPAIQDLDQGNIDGASADETLLVESISDSAGKLTIDTTGLTIKQAPTALGKPTHDTSGNAAFEIKTTDVTLDGLDISAVNSGGNNSAVIRSGIQDTNADGLTIKNCNVDVPGETTGGLYLWNTTEVTNCTIQPTSSGEGLAYGIRFANNDDTAGSTVQNTEVSSAGSDGTFGTGIFVTNTQDIEILDSTVSNNTDGIYLQQVTRGSNSDPVPIDGIDIKRNDIENNGATGVVIGGTTGDDVNINLNNITGSGGVGLGPGGSAESGEAVQNGFENVDATENWWGTPAGPNPLLADGVLQAADVVPWLDDRYPDGKPITEPPEQ